MSYLTHLAVRDGTLMLRNRACDPCAQRKTKCDRRLPCRRCKALGLSCSLLRAHSKPGPKGPWALRKRAGALSPKAPLKTRATDKTATNTAGIAKSPTEAKADEVSAEAVRSYLRIYSQESYPLWPVIDLKDLNTRLQDKTDVAAYALGTALSAVVQERAAQLGKLVGEIEHPRANSEKLAAESEKAREKLLYQQRPSTDVILSSFFLHIHCANRGQICKATLLLREAITFAQFLELDRARHYANLSKTEIQVHLRIIWLLHITERGHTTRFDFPRILRLDPHLPALQEEENPSGLLPFIGMCRLFQNFGHAMDGFRFDQIYDFLPTMDVRLQETRELLFDIPDSQRADFLITKQWMRMILWKQAMFHIKLSADTAGGCLSVSFPEQVARNVMVYINSFPREIVESHGLGMQMKLADIAISFADVLSCAPGTSESYQLMQLGPAGILHCLAAFLASIPNSVNPWLELLQEKISGKVWAFPLGYPPGRGDDSELANEPQHK